MSSQNLSESVMQAIRSGHTVKAIKRLRTETGVGLKEAKDLIDREMATQHTRSFAKNEQLSEPIIQAIRAGHTIQAIKQLRAESGLGLKEAKEIIDSEIDASLSRNEIAPTEKSSSWITLFVIIVIASAIYWYFTTG